MLEVERLSLQQLGGQLLVVGFDGPELPQRLRERLAWCQLGGVILFRRNFTELEGCFRVCRSALAAADASFPPFIGIDQEGGRVRRLLEGVLQLPPMRLLGELDDVELSHHLAQHQAEELRQLGFNVNFAPVADVDSNPDNPIIGDRSFGASVQRVTRHCRAFIEGFQSRGLMACVKHFPGHGDTLLDSHVDLPRVKRSTVELRQTELYPFERLARHAAAAMTAHVVFEAFDAVPATFSPRLLSSLLRREFGFEGVLFSDDLEMGALSRRWSIEESVVMAVDAGCDALLICQSAELQERALGALVARAAEDSRFRARCQEAVERSLVQRRRYPPRPAKSYSQVEQLLRSASARRLRERLPKPERA